MIKLQLDYYILLIMKKLYDKLMKYNLSSSTKYDSSTFLVEIN